MLSSAQHHVFPAELLCWCYHAAYPQRAPQIGSCNVLTVSPGQSVWAVGREGGSEWQAESGGGAEEAPTRWQKPGEHNGCLNVVNIVSAGQCHERTFVPVTPICSLEFIKPAASGEFPQIVMFPTELNKRVSKLNVMKWLRTEQNSPDGQWTTTQIWNSFGVLTLAACFFYNCF